MFCTVLTNELAPSHTYIQHLTSSERINGIVSEIINAPLHIPLFIIDLLYQHVLSIVVTYISLQSRVSSVNHLTYLPFSHLFMKYSEFDDDDFGDDDEDEEEDEDESGSDKLVSKAHSISSETFDDQKANNAVLSSSSKVGQDKSAKASTSTPASVPVPVPAGNAAKSSSKSNKKIEAEEDEDDEEEDDDEVLEAVFKSLAGDKKVVSTKDLLNWDFVLGMMGEGRVTEGEAIFIYQYLRSTYTFV